MEIPTLLFCFRYILTPTENSKPSNGKKKETMNNLEYLYINNPKQLGYLIDDDCDNCEYSGKCHLTKYEPCSSEWLFAEYDPNDFVDSWEKIETAHNKLKTRNSCCEFCDVVNRCKTLVETLTEKEGD